MARKVKLEKAAKILDVAFAPCIDAVYRLKRKDVIISPSVRLKCMTCGAYKRKKTCPPFAPSLAEIKRTLRKMSHFYMIVARNNGTKAWWLGEDPQRDITLAPKKERELKGVNMGMQLYCTRLAKSIQRKFKKLVIAFGPGPCHRCRDCIGTKKCVEPPPIPCMEGWGMDVYGMLDRLKIPYETPVMTELVAVSLIAFYKEEK